MKKDNEELKRTKLYIDMCVCVHARECDSQRIFKLYKCKAQLILKELTQPLTEKKSTHEGYPLPTVLGTFASRSVYVFHISISHKRSFEIISQVALPIYSTIFLPHLFLTLLIILTFFSLCSYILHTTRSLGFILDAHILCIQELSESESAVL